MPKIKADGREYEIPTLNAGELRILKRDFGMAKVTQLDPDDPDHLVGLVYLSIRRVQPSITVEQVETFESIEFLDDEPAEDTPDPPSGAAPDAALNGATIPASSGSPG